MSLMSIFGNNEKGINYLSIFKLSIQYLRQKFNVETKFNIKVIKNYYIADNKGLQQSCARKDTKQFVKSASWEK